MTDNLISNYKKYLTGYTYASLEELVYEIAKKHKGKRRIQLFVSYDEVADLIVALISTDLFTPELLDYSSCELNNYTQEYSVAIFDDGRLFVEPSFNVKHDRYLFDEPFEDDVYVSQKVDISLVEHLIAMGFKNMIYYDFGDTYEE